MQETIVNLWERRFRLSGQAKLSFLPVCIAAMLHAQTFSSGSTGADGDLIVNTAGVTNFTATPVGGGSIYNFKTIQIATGSTLRLSGAVFPGPLYFLAQGAVTIAGTIDLSGQSGSTPSTPAERTGLTVPGPGGYGGGSAAFAGNPALPGLGPAGGPVVGCNGWGGAGGFTGNQFLVPLVGGSGGGGSGSSGGAGGGAILIASSVSITVNGTITANGGSGFYSGPTPSGGGAGGGVRLVASTITGTGTITANWTPSANTCPGSPGIVRLESFQNTFSGSIGANEYLATPVNLFLPAAAAQPSIMVTSIGGAPVPPNPTGSFTVPDVTLNSSSPLTVNIQATNVPAGTTAKVYFSTENFPDQTVVSSPLATTSTQGITTASATVTLNPGYSKGYVVATWTQ